MLLTLDRHEADHVPCCFMSFSILRKQHDEEPYEIVRAEIEMGLDAMLFIPTASRRERPEHMSRLGARVLALVDDASVFAGWQPDYVIELRSGLSDWERGLLYVPVLQRIAYHRAVAKGLDPDHPTHLTAVVELECTAARLAKAQAISEKQPSL
jgi:hypothetical protein